MSTGVLKKVYFYDKIRSCLKPNAYKIYQFLRGNLLNKNFVSVENQFRIATIDKHLI